MRVHQNVWYESCINAVQLWLIMRCCHHKVCCPHRPFGLHPDCTHQHNLVLQLCALPADQWHSVQKDAPPALIAAEVMSLLTLSRAQCKLLVDSKPRIGPSQAMDSSCARILSGLQTSSARLNVICCYARLLEVQLKDTSAAGGLTADKAWRKPAQAAVLLLDTMLDCISQAVLEVKLS